MTVPAPTGPLSPVPSEGRLTTRVRYNECDPMGFVHHAAYFPWLEMGRTELLRVVGASYKAMEEGGFLLVIVRLESRFKRPGRYDDLVEIHTRVVGGGRVKIEHEYTVRCIERDGRPTDETLLTARTTLACIDRAGHPQELPAWLSRRS
ncbi:MAG: acyl-CoA thioesterase [Phycisphaerales bacterium]